MTNKNDLFLKLLKQVHFPDSFEDNELLQKGKIENVDVYAKEHRWDIHVFFDTPLQYDTYVALRKAIEESFASFVNVRFFVNTGDGSDQYLPKYWHYAVQNSNVLQPMAREFLAGQKPEKVDGRWVIPVDNNIIDGIIEQKALDDLALEMRKYGFFNLKFITQVDQSSMENNLQSLEERHEEHEKDMQKQFEQTPEKAKPQPRQYPTKRTSYGKRKLDENAPITQIQDVEDGTRNVVIEGNIFNIESRELKSGAVIFTGEITDYSDSIAFKKFVSDKEQIEQMSAIKPGTWAKMQGTATDDQYQHDIVFNISSFETVEHVGRTEKYEGDQKRVELHLHTNMSQLDATNTPTDFIKTAKKFGQKAIAITDHGDVQSFPEAYSTGKATGMKILYGVEANMIDDHALLVLNPAPMTYEDREFVIFDVETTGLSSVYDTIIEIGAVKMKNGEVLERFDKFINPHHPLSEQTINLTSITDEMVSAADDEDVVIKQFQDFYGDRPLCGHNVQFDVGFVNAALRRAGLSEITQPVVDTLEVSRLLHPEQNRHTLDSLAKKYNVSLEHHHRANQDAEATGYLMYKLLDAFKKKYNEDNLNNLNGYAAHGEVYKRARPSHMTVLAKDQKGLKNLYKLVSIASTKDFYRIPRTPKSDLADLHEGLLYGSGCWQGDVFVAMMQKGYDEAREKAKFYDFLEVQPPATYSQLIADGLIKDEDQLEEIISNIYKLGKELNKPVVATGDSHYVEPHDAIYRTILISAQRSNPNRNKPQPDLHFYSTQEMLDAFSFLGEDIAKEIVIENTNKIADEISEIQPIKDGLYPPHIAHADEEMKKLTYDKAYELYGNPLPKIVKDRIDLELNSIISNGYAVIYLISQRLVAKSNKDGYLVGSRGSVGSSLVATMSGITEVNPLAPHYRCPKCKYSQFFENGEYGSGFDLPDKNCPKCGTPLVKDGQDIPFATFLGFHGDKVPDIDLNFSGDYQPVAHNFIRVMFGPDNSYRAGTIATVADKTAYGYAKHFDEERNLKLRNAELDRLASGIRGVKRTTGQHPAGIVVVPDDMDIYDFTPVSYPADDVNAAWLITHYDFHSIHDNILKFDILGHDDPTMIRHLQDLSGIDPLTIPPDDPGVMSLFSSTKALGVTPEQIGSQTGTLGVPEFGTRFVRGMLEETKPTTFAELLQISGLSHGTDVWLGNAEDLVNNGTCKLKDVIGCRDNIMMDLIHWGVKPEVAFSTMESVRHGRGISDENMAVLKKNKKIPDWYIPSCLKIKYMFPKAHATAYILMALRIAWFKVYYPEIYYTAYFSVRADLFDLVAMSHGKNTVKAAMKEIQDKGMDASAKDKSLLTVLEIANECLERGIKIKMVDIDQSEATDFKILDKHTILAPFNAVPGLGDNAAKQIVAARAEKKFLSKEDLAKRGKVSQTIMNYFEDNGVLEGMPDENQLSLF
ncbi:DNA polymerase III, alpha subunit [Lactobacillus amylovorus]|uniref:DNA polymerase III PolC-type n=2 Tax=Lactobacillus amylovorus TaxID=1604 RepID=F0TFN0_LACAM|nr:PolC-type DNA polymerase III [Lactobacillus amylovorus]CDA27521.1 dNA polymerase III polC-type [Lactobacillus amylovorus CAG:719]ADZ07524.1 DNA polymerase III, alpha subunit [Lactobacillus amylovorus]AEA32221.1 DNA polymerase III, alpha subunit [Lactobacillus amylovorus GRL1118]MCT3595545.1 PolC-type DNA polymerase III [Lactobacillus amylovorus]MDB6251747.1 PolC-type DNA polymerase III [Lactobacillus amylovorus]